MSDNDFAIYYPLQPTQIVRLQKKALSFTLAFFSSFAPIRNAVKPATDPRLFGRLFAASACSEDSQWNVCIVRVGRCKQ